MKKYAIYIWRGTIFSVAAALFIYWTAVANTWTDSIRVGRVLIPTGYFTSNSLKLISP